MDTAGQRPEERISVEWLNDVVFADLIGNPVVEMQTAVIGEGRGFLSDTVAIDLSHEKPQPEDRPRSVIVKMKPRLHPEQTDMEVELRGFEREIAFYRDVAPNLPIKLPEIYFIDDSERDGLIVMENLSHLNPGDQVRGVTQEQGLAVASQIAHLHARYWDNDALKQLDWVPLMDHFNTENFARDWPDFAEEYHLRLGPQAMRVGEWMAENIDALEAEIASRPLAFIHGDLRADNVLLSDDGTGSVIIDWQLASRHLAAFDVVRFMGGSEPEAERAGHQKEFMDAWGDVLRAEGVSTYTAEDALHDFRLASLHCLTIPVKVRTFFGDDPSARQGRLLDAQVQRFFSAVHELQADEALR